MHVPLIAYRLSLSGTVKYVLTVSQCVEVVGRVCTWIEICPCFRFLRCGTCAGEGKTNQNLEFQAWPLGLQAFIYKSMHYTPLTPCALRVRVQDAVEGGRSPGQGHMGSSGDGDDSSGGTSSEMSDPRSYTDRSEVYDRSGDEIDEYELEEDSDSGA